MFMARLLVRAVMVVSQPLRRLRSRSVLKASLSLSWSEFQANRLGANLTLPTHKRRSIQDIAQLAHDTELLNSDRHLTQFNSTRMPHVLASGTTRMMSTWKNPSPPPMTLHLATCASLTSVTRRSRPRRQRLPAVPVIERATLRSLPPLHLATASLPHSSIPPLPSSTRRSGRDDGRDGERSHEDCGLARRRERKNARNP
jgi:hypothetical protein